MNRVEGSVTESSLSKSKSEKQGTDSKPLILIMDDDPILRGVAGESLKQAGFSVSESENGIQALAAIKKHRPDIVLLDVMMPEMDGFDTCRAIRELPDGDMLPVVMITALEDLESINRAYEVGATDFITKPINWIILVQRVRYMLRAVQVNLERNRLQQELQHAQRLKAIGTLASGIAHDFKNLLQIIQGSVELLLLNKSEGAVFSNWGSVAVAVSMNGSGTQRTFQDEIRVGDTLADLNLAAIPEPSILFLAVLGILGLRAARRL